MTSVGELTVVVVDWNLPERTLECVASLVADGVPPGRIVVVENGPTAVNWERIATELSDCVLVWIESNVGFSKANNLGSRTLDGDAYLFVNNDAYVRKPGAVRELLTALDRPDVEIVVPKLLNEDSTLQPSVVPFTTPLPALVRASGISRFVPDHWQPRLGTHWSHDSSREIQAATGAVILVGGRAWDLLGGFCETSFMYAEDLDLCWRAYERGWKTWFASEAEFAHFSSASAGRRWSIRERWRRIARAEAQMIRAHLSAPRAAAAIGVSRAGAGARALYFGATGNAAAAARFRGFAEGLTWGGADGPGGPTDEPATEVVRPRQLT